MTRLAVLAWNCYAANDDDDVLAALSTWAFRHDPDIIALSEAMTHGDALRKWAERHGYTLLQEPPARNRRAGTVDDTGDCAILAAPHVRVRVDWVSVMERAWIVMSHRRWHQPHRYQVAKVIVRGQAWRVRASHWPTLGMHGPNREAWAESALRSRRWMERSSDPSVDVGDLNEKVAALAAWFGQRFDVYGSGIDVAVTRHVTGCEVTELGKGGGDHHGRYYRFSA